jgi:aconitate decarboxylase
MTKSTHCGYAGASGLDAALLASRGFTANPGIFEAPRGYVATYFPQEFEQEKLLAYGKPFRVVDPGLAIKLYPSQFGTHWAITAALELHPKIRDPQSIARVTIRGPEMEYVNRPQPATGLDGKTSFQYTAAAALLDGRVGIETFSDARRFRSDMVALLGKIELIQDPSIPGEWRGMHVTVEVETRGGKRFTARCDSPRGAWGQPALRPEEHEVKLRDCLGHLLDGRRVTRLLGMLDSLERQTPRGVKAMIELIAPRPRRASSASTRRRARARRGRL